MLNDPIFLRHKDHVWPFFWPVLLVSIALLRRQTDGMFARGCISFTYSVSYLGVVSITDMEFPRARPHWKDSLFFVTGRYDGVSMGGAIAPDTQSADDFAERLNIVFWARKQVSETEPTDVRAQSGRGRLLSAGLPLPHI